MSIRKAHRETIKPETPPPPQTDNNSQSVASDEMAVAEKTVLTQRARRVQKKKSQSDIDENIQVREKRGNEWWDELGILLPERDQYLQRRGNIIEFMNGTADSLSQLSQSCHPHEFIKIITNDTGTEKTVPNDYSEWGDRSCSEVSKDGGIVDLPIPPPC
ncbi:MAG: hypothetical protein F6K40_20185 [Okeania sp. SIO3I5]|uniref:hypothetical protein n=1 Tax=Okeania sp. SIO3I5 TaxID=2607805 RepID=UPI0013BDDF25|nr:hypothetical protein [Okeania sp. SIO3I5]NEQ38459.1 hypothetical protein [Okeania sp. SIO3I5]